MKVLLHLVGRQIHQERGLVVAMMAVGGLGALIGVLGKPEYFPPAAPFMKGAFLLGTLAVGCVWLTGFGGGDRREFDLARPLSAWQLCAGKLLGSLLAVAISALAAGLPIALFRPARTLAAIAGNLSAALSPASPIFRGMIVDTPPRQVGVLEGYFWSLACWPLFFLAAIALIQTVSLCVVARTRHSLLCLGALALFAAAFSRAFYRLSEAGALGVGVTWLIFLLVAVAALGVLSAWRSFTRGSLAVPAFRAYSFSMSAGLVLLAGVLLLAGRFAVPRPDFGGLLGYSTVVANDDGSLWLVGGYQDRRGFAPLFLVEPATQRATYLAPATLTTAPENLSHTTVELGVWDRQSLFSALYPGKSWCGVGDPNGFGVFAATPGQAPKLLRRGVANQGGPLGSTLAPPRLTRLDVSGSRRAQIEGSRILVHDTAADRQLAALEVPPNATLAGEIRPGLLAASFSSREKPCPVYGFADGCGLETYGDWTTLLVDTATGEVVRTLPGFAAHANSTGDGKVWLVGPYGEPYDLESAAAEPRLILPWRPRAAEEARR